MKLFKNFPLKIYFYTTEDEAFSDSYRCNHEDVIIEDYFNHRWLGYKIGYSLRGITDENFEKEFEKNVTSLIEKQDSELWITGYGYVHSSEVNLWLRIKGYLKKLGCLNIYWYKETDEEIPF